MGLTFAFVDESGNHDLDTDKLGSSNFFVVCAVIAQEKDIKQAYDKAEEIRSRNFQTGEMKSSNIKAKDPDRRNRILQELSSLPIKIFVTVVDKSRVHQDGGLQFKKSFIKKVNGILYERLFNQCSHLKMVVDEHGGPDFQNSLKEYVNARYASDLFGHEAFQTQSSKNNVLIQTADFFAGSIAQIYEGKASAQVEEAYKQILRKITLGIIEWPPKYNSLIPPPMDPTTYSDYLVHQAAIKQADKFIEKIGNLSDDDQKLQRCILDYLRFRSDFVSDEYVSTVEISDHLLNSGFGNVTEQKIRSTGIAKLRDAEVIIASASKGYKFPRARADINDFVDLAANQVVPLLERVKKARDVYLLSSVGEYDILAAEAHEKLKNLLSSIDPLGS